MRQHEELLTDLDRIRARFDGVMARAGERLDTPPAPGAWSAAECIAHLNTTNRLFLGSIRGALSRASRSSAPVTSPVASTFMGRWFVGIVGEQARQKVPAQKKVRPPSAVSGQSAAEEFRQILDEIATLLREHETVDLNKAVFRSPLFALSRLRAGTGMKVLIAHMNRHLAQAERAISARS